LTDGDGGDGTAVGEDAVASKSEAFVPDLLLPLPTYPLVAGVVVVVVWG